MKYKYRESLKKIIFLFFFLLKITLNATNYEIRNSNFKYLKNSLKLDSHKFIYPYGFPVNFIEKIRPNVPLTKKIAIDILEVYNVESDYFSNANFRRKFNYFLHHKYGEPPSSITGEIMEELELSKDSLNSLRKNKKFIGNLKALEAEIKNIKFDREIYKNIFYSASINVKTRDILAEKTTKLRILIENIDSLLRKVKNDENKKSIFYIDSSKNNDIGEQITPTFPLPKCESIIFLRQENPSSKKLEPTKELKKISINATPTKKPSIMEIIKAKFEKIPKIFKFFNKKPV